MIAIFSLANILFDISLTENILLLLFGHSL
jgi:hypothetical protein